MRPSTPSLPESSLVNYLGQVFHVNVGACSSFDDVLELLEAHDIFVPGLQQEDSPIFIPNRMQLHAAMYNLREGSELAELLEAFISDPHGSMYAVMQDTTFAGKDGLFLLSVSVDEDSAEACSNNIAYMPTVWGKFGNPVANIMTGGCKMKNGDVLSVVALQLASIARK